MAATLKEIQREVRSTRVKEGGVLGMQTVQCIECRLPFTIPIHRGTKPLYCHRRPCQEAKAAEERLRNAQRKREAATRAKLYGLVEAMVSSEEVMLRQREILDVIERVAEFKPTQDNPRLELKRFVLACARAKGVRPWRTALLELAACAIFLASQFNDGVDKKAVK